ncbi:MAG: hypothetical protein QM784_31790 [Polyangiaceae bacterium]
MRAELQAIFERLNAKGPRNISLDEIGDVIGAALISQAEIEMLFDALETAGSHVGGPSPSLKEHLMSVLREARRLQQATASAPRVEDIAMATGLSAGEVRAALLYASVLSR